jgi:hypothetical protein
VAFFTLQSGLGLSLWPRKSLSADSTLPMQGRSSVEFSLAHNVDSAAEVDAVMKQAADAGARIVKPAQPTFYGGMPATSSIWTVTCGKSRSIPDWARWHEGRRDYELTIAL